jgi:hypothetical protein
MAKAKSALTCGCPVVPVIAAIRDWGARHLAQPDTMEMVAAE